MFIISQNLVNSGISIPNDAIFRINLAWVNGIEELERLLKKHQSHKIFLDLPVKRTKPPNNNYSIHDLVPLIKSHKNIKYFAISNVESANDLNEYTQFIPKDIVIVPKIENELGISNIEEITNTLTNKKIIMLDHDDLFSSLVKQNKSSSFKDHVNKLVDFCDTNKIILLRTKGVIFGDDEKRVT